MRVHLATLLDDFRQHERDIAIVHYRGNRRRVMRYGELVRLSGRFAALLAQRGIGSGDRVVLWAANSGEWIAAYYGCMLRGVLVVPLDAYGSADFALRVATDVKPSLVVGDAELLVKLLKEANANWSTLSFEEWETSLPANEAGPIEGLNSGTPLQILFTSGTTGDPKGIVHTHGNVLASMGPVEDAAQKYMPYEKLVHPLRFLHTLPMSHVFGQTMGLWVPAIFSAEVHFESRLVATRLVETIRRERISVLAAVPRVMALVRTQLEARIPSLRERLTKSQGKSAGTFGWKRWLRFRDAHSLLGLKFWALISGGGALSSDLEQFWNGLGFVVVQGYGMTETTALITLNHPFHVASGTIGKPLPGREVKIGADGEVFVRGPMISSATWQSGALHKREDEWLATGDLAEQEATGDLKFLGRKSEVIVTSSGVNIHPEDLEAALDAQTGIAASAVVAVETPQGPEPFAVLALRAGADAAAAVAAANAGLAEFQRVHRWKIWPEPDLPRTSTGKVRRKAVATWATTQMGAPSLNGTSAVSSTHHEWLLALIAELGGEVPAEGGDELRLSEDLHLDSLARVQLAAALEEKLGTGLDDEMLDLARTVGDLRALVGGAARAEEYATPTHQKEAEPFAPFAPESPNAAEPQSPHPHTVAQPAEAAARVDEEKFLYPYWPWSRPVAWIRKAFLELVAQPLVWFLAAPKIVGSPDLRGSDPMLIICNHVTAYDGPLVQYALPGRIRRHMAAMMAGEMLEDYRHFRNPERLPCQSRFMLLGPLVYILATGLFNVFPLPRRRDFQRSFQHAGEALDRGINVMVFPEGTRSAAGQLADFRPGIGLLVKQSHAPVLPVAIRGLGELKERGKGWFRSGKVEVHVGKPIRFDWSATEAQITERLRTEVAKLLGVSETFRYATITTNAAPE
ncbi:MAG: AMP-binding protein [Acidobacteriota bacterium]|nr:AMP-binding protein [Acidobacteriota bacterium]